MQGFNDFVRGQENNLAFVSTMNDDETFNSKAGPFAGMKRFDARYKVVNALNKKRLYVKWEPNSMNVPLCIKSGDVI